MAVKLGLSLKVSGFQTLYNGTPPPPSAQQRFHHAPFLTLCVFVCVKNSFISFYFLKSTLSGFYQLIFTKIL
jgi:hypothetical protein